ncbi:hypothetical protein ACTFJW_02610 [Clostridium cagae]|uniref:hypothetical protein n=1 Tax=Clostridium cagae TaxID=2080751 RepID=UPI003F75D181
MKKFKIEIDENVTYRHELVVEAESEEILNKALNEIERHGNHPDDIGYYLKNEDVEILELTKDVDGDGCDFECTDLDEIKE